MKFKEMSLAHKYCNGKGIEIGPAAHNPFNIPGCTFVSPRERIEFWNKSQEEMCGEHIEIDFYADAESLPFANETQDYVLSSHVIEHVPNPVKAFLEWNRVLKPGGIMFMIFPKRDADEGDRNKPISEIEDFFNQYENPIALNDENGHIWIFTLESMVTLINKCIDKFNIPWEIIKTEETDSKVGNGHTIICRKKHVEY